MVNEKKNQQFAGLPKTDALFLGTAVLEHAGYHPLSLFRPPSQVFQKTCGEDRLEPGLIHYMLVCLPFKYIYTHGDCGIIAKADKTVNKEDGPIVVPVTEKEPVTIEYLPSYWQQMMIKSPTPVYGTYHPRELFIASINREYDTAALDEFLFQCKSSSPGFQAFLLADEPLEKSVVKQHQVIRLKITLEDYLNREGFQGYYRRRLRRLFKEYRHWSPGPGFVDKERSPFIRVSGDFSLEPGEKKWLTSFNGDIRSWCGSKEWAGFGMLYTLYYLKGELASVADLGHIPSFEREYHRLFTTINDLYQAVRKTACKKPVPVYRQWKDEWFHQEKSSLYVLAYYYNQMLNHPSNPVCAAFLCQALDAYSWDNIAAEFRQEALQWIDTAKDQWEAFMTGRSIDLFSPGGKEEFLVFLEGQEKKQAGMEPGTEPITEKAVGGFCGRFSVTWERMADYFRQLCWQRLSAEEEDAALTKLLSLMEKLKTILKNIMEQANGAMDELKVFLEEISVPTSFMTRLAHYIAGKDKPEPLPLYVSGEILEIKDAVLGVAIEISGEDDWEREIPIADFPAENPQVGRRFFAKIDEDRPGIVYDIEPMKMRKQRTFDEIFIGLFGEDVYTKVVSHNSGLE